MSGRTKRRIRAGAAGAALAVTILLALLRLGMIGPLPAGSPDDLLRLLVAVALLLVAALTHGTHPTTAWLATIGSATVVALDLAIYARVVRPLVDATSMAVARDRGESGVDPRGRDGSCLAASRPVLRDGRFTVEATVVATLGGLGTGGLGAQQSLGVGVRDRGGLADRQPGRRDPDVPPRHRGVRRARRRGRRLAVGGAGTAAGRPAPSRAGVAPRPRPGVGCRHSPTNCRGDAGARGPPSSPSGPASPPTSTRTSFRASAGSSPTRKAGAPAESLASSLREVLTEVESVGGDRHAVQLDIGGLVPALAWLAERIERRSDVTVTIDVEDTASPPPPDVAAGAFRIAGLALTNVMWHAPRSRAAIAVRADAVGRRHDDPRRRPGHLARGDRVGPGRRSSGDRRYGRGGGGMRRIARRRAGARTDSGTAVSFRWRAAGGEADQVVVCRGSPR